MFQAAGAESPPPSCSPDEVSHGYVTIGVKIWIGVNTEFSSCCLFRKWWKSDAAETLLSRDINDNSSVCASAWCEDSLCWNGLRSTSSAVSRLPWELVLLEVPGNVFRLDFTWKFGCCTRLYIETKSKHSCAWTSSPLSGRSRPWQQQGSGCWLWTWRGTESPQRPQVCVGQRSTLNRSF